MPSLKCRPRRKQTFSTMLNCELHTYFWLYAIFSHTFTYTHAFILAVLSKNVRFIKKHIHLYLWLHACNSRNSDTHSHTLGIMLAVLYILMHSHHTFTYACNPLHSHTNSHILLASYLQFCTFKHRFFGFMLTVICILIHISQKTKICLHNCKYSLLHFENAKMQFNLYYIFFFRMKNIISTQ